MKPAERVGPVEPIDIVNNVVTFLGISDRVSNVKISFILYKIQEIFYLYHWPSKAGISVDQGSSTRISRT